MSKKSHRINFYLFFIKNKLFAITPLIDFTCETGSCHLIGCSRSRDFNYKKADTCEMGGSSFWLEQTNHVTIAYRPSFSFALFSPHLSSEEARLWRNVRTFSSLFCWKNSLKESPLISLRGFLTYLFRKNSAKKGTRRWVPQAAAVWSPSAWPCPPLTEAWWPYLGSHFPQYRRSEPPSVLWKPWKRQKYTFAVPLNPRFGLAWQCSVFLKNQKRFYLPFGFLSDPPVDLVSPAGLWPGSREET